MNDFAALFTDKSNGWKLLVRLKGTITTSQLFAAQFLQCIIVFPFKGVHVDQGM